MKNSTTVEMEVSTLKHSLQMSTDNLQTKEGHIIMKMDSTKKVNTELNTTEREETTETRDTAENRVVTMINIRISDNTGKDNTKTKVTGWRKSKFTTIKLTGTIVPTKTIRVPEYSTVIKHPE